MREVISSVLVAVIVVMSVTVARAAEPAVVSPQAEGRGLMSAKEVADWEKIWQVGKRKPFNLILFCYSYVMDQKTKVVNGVTSDDKKQELVVNMHGYEGLAIASIDTCNRIMADLAFFPNDHPDYAKVELMTRHTARRMDKEFLAKKCTSDYCKKHALDSFAYNATQPLEHSAFKKPGALISETKSK